MDILLKLYSFYYHYLSTLIVLISKPRVLTIHLFLGKTLGEALVQIKHELVTFHFVIFLASKGWNLNNKITLNICFISFITHLQDSEYKSVTILIHPMGVQ